ncbi:DUF2946 family protein [Acinetobacter sp. ANC 4641]|uniref:DUF2946 family protein n=1 Tax=Acinetobacter sp. ANC 4641 TaxID=2529847 RepID=UPI00103B581A|nr:DUF2946 family protein [Acinetobacter sp. ANC 4641]TCB11605.1 DUF2946 domain-containing protein [Acinetobacter sp. ANC 4641]
MLLQIAVFLQALLPENFQISPVCATVSDALALTNHSYTTQMDMSMADMSHMQDMHMSSHVSVHDKHQHDPNHECLYCKVYGHVVAFLDFEIKEVFERLQVRLIAFQKAFKHIYFVLQRLFLIPQGRAPPLFA